MDDMIAADVGVRQLQARFIDAVWRQDADDFANCWTADGVWKIAGMELRGRDAIRATCNKLLGRCEKIQLILMPALLEVSGKTAIGRHHVIEYAKMLDGSGWMTIGVYHDRLAGEEGRWRFAHRHWAMQYRGPLDLSASFVAGQDFGPF
ncbi:MAG: nuclear transport factor 2 family protein, partial [Alphaproteobacteria bacterium]|nr:nuclear transport factor 2 family protein [Alphaproteobacteria bacterium]